MKKKTGNKSCPLKASGILQKVKESKYEWLRVMTYTWNIF